MFLFIMKLLYDNFKDNFIIILMIEITTGNKKQVKLMK